VSGVLNWGSQFNTVAMSRSTFAKQLLLRRSSCSECAQKSSYGAFPTRTARATIAQTAAPWSVLRQPLHQATATQHTATPSEHTIGHLTQPCPCPRTQVVRATNGSPSRKQAGAVPSIAAASAGKRFMALTCAPSTRQYAITCSVAGGNFSRKVRDTPKKPALGRRINMRLRLKPR
jgi:hypothetical protein